ICCKKNPLHQFKRYSKMKIVFSPNEVSSSFVAVNSIIAVIKEIDPSADEERLMAEFMGTSTALPDGTIVVELSETFIVAINQTVAALATKVLPLIKPMKGFFGDVSTELNAI